MARKQTQPKKPSKRAPLPLLAEPKPLFETETGVIINDDFSYVSPKDGKTYRMTLKEKSFCEAYLELKGDGVDAIIEAGYDVFNARTGEPNYKLAAVMAFENLRKPNLFAYINSMLEEMGFGDENVEKQHLFVLNQHADIKSKMKAIEVFYRLKGKLNGGDSAPPATINYNLFYKPEFQDTLHEFEAKAKEAIKNVQPIQENSDSQ